VIHSLEEMTIFNSIRQNVMFRNPPFFKVRLFRRPRDFEHVAEAVVQGEMDGSLSLETVQIQLGTKGACHVSVYSVPSQSCSESRS